MSTETNQEAKVTPEVTEGEGKETTVETVTIPKEEYGKMNETLGSLKRQLKDLQKSREDAKETSTKNQPEENALLQRIEGLALAHAGIDHEDDVELARNTAKKWNMPLENVLRDEDFKVKLERQQTARSNAVATSNIRGGQGTSQAKNTPEYWRAKGSRPTPAEVPDRKTRAKIIREMMKDAATGGKKFYND